MIRKMRESDRQTYFDMSREFYASGAAKGEITDKVRADFWRYIADGQSVKGYIIENGGKPAGYALTVSYPSQEFGGNVLWIDELFVKPEFRGQGLGKEFLQFAGTLENNVLLRLEAEPDNEKAIKLYETLGFAPLKYLQMIKRTKL